MRSGVCVAERADREFTVMTPSSIAARARSRQAAALQAADEYAQRRQERRSRTRLAADLGLGYDQYARYVNGETPLRIEQIELFAQVYGLDAAVLGRAILTGDTTEIEALLQQPAFDMADYLQRGGVLAADIPGFVEKHCGESPESQKFAADGYIRTTRRAQKRASSRTRLA